MHSQNQCLPEKVAMPNFIVNNQRKLISLLALLLLFSLLFQGCSKKSNVPTKSVLAVVISAYPDLPDIRICHSDAAESDEYYLDKDLSLSLFGQNGEMPDFSAIEEFSLFIAKGQQIIEFAVFKSYTYASTQDIALMCQKRLETLKKNCPECFGEIFTVGKYVIYTLLPDNQNAKKICRQMLS